MGQFETKTTFDKTKNSITKVECWNCLGKTNHKILQSVHQSCYEVLYDEEIGSFNGVGEDFTWEILQCLGCESICFREQYYFSENDYVDENGQFIPDIRTTIYPKRIRGRKPFINNDFRKILPAQIQNIYSETFDAIGNEQPVLSGIGIRALVESVCKEKNAVGNNLKNKIDNLVVMGLLSRTHAETLQKLRIMGNQAAHEVHPHSEKNLLMALDIVEHLLREVYILPTQSQHL